MMRVEKLKMLFLSLLASS